MTGSQREPRWWQRQLQQFAATRPGAWLFSHTAHHVDRVLMAVSGGRVSMSQVLAGLPTIRLTTTGAKTGKERTVPVMGIRDGDRWIVVASNWGGDGHPAWYYNLRANPGVEVTHGDETGEYVARELDGDRREEYWRRATELYAGFEPYRRRADREIPVVELRPSSEETKKSTESE